MLRIYRWYINLKVTIASVSLYFQLKFIKALLLTGNKSYSSVWGEYTWQKLRV